MILVGVCFITRRTVLFSPEKESKRLVSGEATKILADWRVKDSCQDVICH